MMGCCFPTVVVSCLSRSTPQDMSVRAVGAQLIVAMGKAGYLSFPGGRELVFFVIRQCAMSEGEKAAFNKAQKQKGGWFGGGDGGGLSPAQLQLMCKRILDNLTEVAGAAVWPHPLVDAILPQEFSEALPSICKCLAAVAADPDINAAGASFDADPDMPSGAEVMARLVVAAGTNEERRKK